MRYARGEAILRVIAMRYAPQLLVSQKRPDTVGELGSADNLASCRASCAAQRLGASSVGTLACRVEIGSPTVSDRFLRQILHLCRTS